jgi:hypothetical protein
MDMPQIMLRICNRFFYNEDEFSIFFIRLRVIRISQNRSALFWVLMHLFVIDSRIHI